MFFVQCIKQVDMLYLTVNDKRILRTQFRVKKSDTIKLNL